MKDILFAVTVIAVFSAVWIDSSVSDSRLERTGAETLCYVSALRDDLNDAVRRISKMERFLAGKYEERASSGVITVVPPKSPGRVPLHESFVCPVYATSERLVEPEVAKFVVGTTECHFSTNSCGTFVKEETE